MPQAKPIEFNGYRFKSLRILHLSKESQLDKHYNATIPLIPCKYCKTPYFTAFIQKN